MFNIKVEGIDEPEKSLNDLTEIIYGQDSKRINEKNLYLGHDSGESWNKLTTEWPNEYAPFALAVSE